MTLARALTILIEEHINRAAAEMGYTHGEHLSGPEWPATEIPCLPATVAVQIAEKHLMEVLGDMPAEPLVEAAA